ncbi:DUF2809 domain-containing protein [Paenibacillus sambharensis]|nr:DUF2809 domain-containing protein [Paenibacillus sambharensis]
MNRRRLRYLLAGMLMMGLGLVTRAMASSLPDFLADHAGDALWAAMIYMGIRFLRPDIHPLLSAGACLFFCLLVEASQLYQADWINEIRRSAIGALVLGRGFLYVDLLRYTAGTGIAVAADMAAFGKRDRLEV